jgi:ABC-type Fe3+ transport system substrate-binding protein
MAFVALALAACSEGGPSGAHTTTAAGRGVVFSGTWEQLADAARAEGELVIATGSGRSRDHRRIFEYFGRQFGVDVIATTGTGGTIVERVLAERSRGLYTIDVSMVGLTSNERLHAAHALAPLPPAFLLADVVDRSHGWRVDRHVWGDADAKHVALSSVSVGSNLSDIYFNTDLVGDSEMDAVRSWGDFLTPAWRGRIVAILDPTHEEGTSHWVSAWRALGDEWFGRFVRDADVHLMPESAQREVADGLARGKYQVALFLPPSAEWDIERLGSLGMPVRKLERTLAEGRSITLSGPIALFDCAPHPHAAQLFVNWYLSREGQEVRNSLIDGVDPSPSLRSDVSQGRIPNEQWIAAQSPEVRGLVPRRRDFVARDRRDSAMFIRRVCADVGCYGYGSSRPDEARR